MYDDVSDTEVPPVMNTSTLAPTPRPTSTYAIIALVSGILGWTLLPFLGSISAIIFGHLGRAEIRREPQMEGAGMALAGLILGYLSLAIGALVVLFLIGMVGVLALQGA